MQRPTTASSGSSPTAAVGSPVPKTMGRRWRIRVGATVALVALLWGFVALDAFKAGRHVFEFSRFSDLEAPNPVPSATSSTGYENGLRWIDLDTELDAYYWIMQAQAMDAGFGIRQRRTYFDNAPEGRENHWALPHRAWLAGIGYLIHRIEHVPLGVGVERGALCDGPILLGLLGVILIGIAAWRYSLWEAGVVVLGFIGFGTLRDYFAPADADHHGMIAASLLLMLSCLDLGLREIAAGADDDRRTGIADRWMIAAGLCGGFGLWMSAATIVPAIAALGIGAAASRFAGEKGARQTRYSRAWRRWGMAGSVTAILCYLIEYFPHHMSLRLEVNHPLYALAWWGGSEVIGLIWQGGRATGAEARRLVGRWALAVGAVASLPVVFALTHKESFLAGDPLHLAIMEHFVIEFQSCWHYFANLGFEWSIFLAAVSLIFPLALLAQCALGNMTGSMARRLLPTGVAAVLIGLLGLFQVRWLGMMVAANLWLLVAWLDECARSAETPRRRVGWRILVAGILLLPGCVEAGVSLAQPNPGFSNEDIWRLADRSLAYRLRMRVGPEASATVLSAPDMTAWLAYYGSLKGLGSFYWENVTGLHKAAEIYAAPSMEDAHRLIQRWGISQIVVASWDAFEPLYVKLHRNLPKSAPVPEDTFIFQLIQRGIVPSWLRRVPYRLPDHPAFKDQTILIYDVVADQPEDVRLANEVTAMVESGEIESAKRRELTLRSMPSSIPAQLALAKLIGPERAVVEVAPQVRSLEPTAGPLRLADRIELALLYAQAGWLQDAAGELTRSWSLADEADVRRLSPDTLDSWVRLGDALHLPMRDESLHKLVTGLIPPYLQ